MFRTGTLPSAIYRYTYAHCPLQDEPCLVSAAMSLRVGLPRHSFPRSLDSIGIAGFSHDFGSLEGKHSAVAEVFDAMGRLKPSPVTAIIILFSSIFPFLRHLPTETRKLQTKLNRAMEEIAVPLLENTRREMRGLGEKGNEEKSIIGLLSRWMRACDTLYDLEGPSRS